MPSFDNKPTEKLLTFGQHKPSYPWQLCSASWNRHRIKWALRIVEPYLSLSDCRKLVPSIYVMAWRSGVNCNFGKRFLCSSQESEVRRARQISRLRLDSQAANPARRKPTNSRVASKASMLINNTQRLPAKVWLASLTQLISGTD